MAQDSKSATLMTLHLHGRSRGSRGYMKQLAGLFLASFVVSSFYIYHSLGSGMRAERIPRFADRIRAECVALNLKPGTSSRFKYRSISDRFVHGTTPTLITNATIWTGNDSGKEIIHGGNVLLDGGIIKYVGLDEPPAKLLSPSLNHKIQRINAGLAWVTPGIVDMHNHAGVASLPSLSGSEDGNSFQGITQPWLRSIDGIDTHDMAYELSRAGGVTAALILPGSANAIGGQAFMIKLRATAEKSPLSMVLEPPFNIPQNNTHIDRSTPLRWRHIKHATGENPSNTYAGTRMDTIWKFREAYNEARKIKRAQDEYCSKALSNNWTGLASNMPYDLKWEALVDVLRGRVKVNVHIYETVDFTSIVGLSNEFQFEIAGFHHAHEAYLVPDVIKQAWGRTPGVATFATFARYKRESFRGSEFGPRILHDEGIRVAMKSDAPFPISARYLMYEAAQAHAYGLDTAASLQSVTTIPAELTGFDHRIGFVRKAYDADIVLWDSHPLSLGATPQQVWIDGVAQIANPNISKKPEQFQSTPKPRNFDKEAKDAVAFDGLPPLNRGSRVTDRVAFTHVKSFWVKGPKGSITSNFTSRALGGGAVIIDNGIVLCVSESLLGCDRNLDGNVTVVDLEGGSIAPGFVSYGAPLGLQEIAAEVSTGDGFVSNSLYSANPSLTLENIDARAADALIFGTRDALLAYRSGVTSAISAPSIINGLYRGISVAFLPGASDRLDDGALLDEAVALHVTLSHNISPSISQQISLLRKGLLGGFGGDRGHWFARAAKGEIPLAVDVQKSDYMLTMLALKKEVDNVIGCSIRLVFLGASEAHLVADHLASAGNVSVILLPTRQIPITWDQARILPGPPLTRESSVEVLLRAAESSANGSGTMHVALGVMGGLGGWMVRNTRNDVGWVALASNGTISKEKAIALASTEIEQIFGLKYSADLVAYQGGDFTQIESRVVAVISPKGKYIDIL